MVPTPPEILRLNRFFLKIPVLIAKKPCIIEALENAQKPDNLYSVPKSGAHRRLLWPEIKGVLPAPENRCFFRENGEIRVPVLPVWRRKASGWGDHLPDVPLDAVGAIHSRARDPSDVNASNREPG